MPHDKSRGLGGKLEPSRLDSLQPLLRVFTEGPKFNLSSTAEVCVHFFTPFAAENDN
jgi:hypothetical protein